MDIGSMKCNIHSIYWYKFSQYELSIRVEIDKLCDEIYCEGEIEMNYLRNKEGSKLLYYRCKGIFFSKYVMNLIRNTYILFI